MKLALPVLILGLCLLPGWLPADTVFVSVYDNTNVDGEILELNGSGSSATVTTFASGFTQPEGIAFDSSGYLYVLDGSTIYKIDPAGNKSVFVNDPLLNGQPGSGLAIDAQGNVYAPAVTSQFYSVINEYNSSGVYVRTLTAPGGSDLMSGLAFNSAGDLIGAENFGNSIGSFAPDGTYSQVLPGATTITQPDAVTFNSAGKLYVSGGQNHVYAVSSTGAISNYLTVSSHGGDVYTGGMVFDQNGNLFTANQSAFTGTHNSITETTSLGVTTTFASLSSTELPNFLAIDSVSTPEPSTWALLALGAMGCWQLRRSQRKS